MKLFYIAILVCIFLGEAYWRKCKELEEIKSFWIEPPNRLLHFMQENFTYPACKDNLQSVGSNLIQDGIDHLWERKLLYDALEKYGADSEEFSERCKALLSYNPIDKYHFQ